MLQLIPYRSESVVALALCASSLTGSLSAAEIAPREMPAALSRVVDFAEDVKPILDRSCIQCHANGKSKGGFNIDHIHAFIAGGTAVLPW